MLLCQQTLLRQLNGESAAIRSYPTTIELFGYSRGDATTTKAVKHKVVCFL